MVLGVSALAIFPGWVAYDPEQDETAPIPSFPSIRMPTFVFVMTATASALIFIGAVGQHIATNATISTLRTVTYGTIEGSTGVTAMVLAWISFVVYLLFAGGLLFMIYSILQVQHIADGTDAAESTEEE